MKIKSLIIIGLLIALMIAPAGAIETGKLIDLGYSYQLHPWYGGMTEFTSGYSHTAPADKIIYQVSVDVPYNNPYEIMYYAFTLTDGTVHRGSYQCLNASAYTITLDGASYTGFYDYNLAMTLMQVLGQYPSNCFYILYGSKLNDKTQMGVYIISQSYTNSMSVDTKTTVLLLPLGSNSTAIKSFSASSNYKCAVMCVDETLLRLQQDKQGEQPVPSAWASNQTGSIDTGFTYYTNLITKFANGLISVGSAALDIVLLIALIFWLFIQPINFMMIIIIFEELAAIVALSGKGDVLDAIGRYARYNMTAFQFIVMMAEAMIGVISAVIQALSVAVQVGVQMAQTAGNTIMGFASWLLTLIAILPK